MVDLITSAEVFNTKRVLVELGEPLINRSPPKVLVLGVVSLVVQTVGGVISLLLLV